MPTQTERGYLVLADISGYTSFVAGVELEHAHEILTDLLEVIVTRFRVMMTICKLEGDAVFANVAQALLRRPEALLELVEDTYIAFRRRRDSSQRRTTCDCRACQSMPSLELKFFIHYGDYVVQSISGIRELVGSDINLIHRLTKNHLSEATGWHAYTLFTQNALDCMHLNIDGLHAQTEAYEHLGEVKTFSMDMRARYNKLVETQHVVIEPKDADLILEHEFDVAPALVWQSITDPALLTQTIREGGHWSAITRPGGRAGVGARNHCAHGEGSMSYTYLDWRPFQYFTAEGVDGKQTHWETFLVEPLADGTRTRLTIRIKAAAPFPKWVRHQLLVRMAQPGFLDFFERSQELLKRYANDEAPKPGPASTASGAPS